MTENEAVVLISQIVLSKTKDSRGGRETEAARDPRPRHRRHHWHLSRNARWIVFALCAGAVLGFVLVHGIH